MARKRKARGKELKAKVALAAMSGQSPSQLASRFGVHPAQVAAWKKQLVERADDRQPAHEFGDEPVLDQILRFHLFERAADVAVAHRLDVRLEAERRVTFETGDIARLKTPHF